MKILIVSATLQEIAPLLPHLRLLEEKPAGVKRYSLNNLSIDLLVTGVGMVATAFRLGRCLLHERYDFALNVGIAGSFSRELCIGDVVNVHTDCFAEMGAEEGEEFLSVFEIALMDTDEKPFQDGWLHGTYRLRDFKEAKGITVNTVHGNEKNISDTVRRFSPDVESMEGAAFFYTCLSDGTPCAQLRAISNYVAKRNREAWDIPLAIANLNKRMMCLFGAS